MRTEDLRRYPIFHNFIKNNGRIWFWDLVKNALFFVEDNSDYAERVSLKIYERYNNTKGSLFGKILCYKEKLLCVPLFSNEILIYDIKTGGEDYIQLPSRDWGRVSEKRGKFWDVVIDQGIVFLIGYWIPCILKYNWLTKEINILDLYIDKPNRNDETVFFKGAAIWKEKLLLPACTENIVFLIDKANLKFTSVSFDGMTGGFSAIAIDECEAWLMPRKTGPIVCWNMETEEINYYDDYPRQFFFSDKPGIGFVVIHEDEVYVFPLNASSILSINKKNTQIVIHERLNHDYIGKEKSKRQKVYDVKVIDKGIWFFDGLEKCIKVFEVDTGIVTKRHIVFTDEYIEARIKELRRQMGIQLKADKMILESEYAFPTYIQMLLDGAMESKHTCRREDTIIGEKIYRRLVPHE